MSKQTSKKWVGMMLVAALTAALLAACSGGGSNAGDKDSTAANSSPSAGTASEPAKETPYLEVWRNLNNTFSIEKEGVLSRWYIGETGIGVYMPYVPWNSGSDYVQKLNTRIASGDLPDMFLPWQGNEAALIKQGALADLTDLLPVHAPHVWEQVPQEVWDVVRSADPTGEGRIYYVPLIQAYTYYGAFIRQDWLDRVGLAVPRTKDEYVNVLRAFRDQDANGNGIADDEVPVTGREQGRWMDHLFAMYGVAMVEGYPVWDLYDGEITYSAVTENMRDAIAFIRDLYAEKLLDPNVFLNKGDDWQALINGDKAGSYFHINETQQSRIENMTKINPDAHLVALGVPSVPGYEGFYTIMQNNRPQWVIADKDEETVINALRLLNWGADPANLEKRILGVEGMHHKIVDGKPVLLPFEPDKSETLIVGSIASTFETMKYQFEVQANSASEGQQSYLRQRDAIFEGNQPYGKVIAGDGIPATIWDGYSDLKNHTMYQEYMTKIIIGQWSLEKFDEFVDKWYKSGGSEVTQRARDWYDSIRK